jgi:hypothetical protein
LLLKAQAPECREEVDMGVVSLIVMEPGSDWPRHELLSLAGGLSQGLQGSTAAVSLRFC